MKWDFKLSDSMSSEETPSDGPDAGQPGQHALEDGNLPETERLLSLAEPKIHGPGTSHLRTSALGIELA